MELVIASASAAVALMVKSAVESMGEKSGEMSWGAVKKLFKLIRSRFSGDTEAETSLAELDKNPQEDAVQESLQRILTAYMLRDQHFCDELVRFVEQAEGRTAGAGNISASVINNAHVFNGKVEISGDWNSR